MHLSPAVSDVTRNGTEENHADLFNYFQYDRHDVLSDSSCAQSSAISKDDDNDVENGTKAIPILDEDILMQAQPRDETLSEKRKLRYPVSAFTTPMYCEISLLKLLNDRNAHHSLYSDIVKWAQQCKALGYDFQPTRKKRRDQIYHIQQLSKKPTRFPFIVNVEFIDERRRFDVPVTSFDFQAELLSLLHSPVFEDINNLDVNLDEPFAKYESASGKIECFNGGQWYHDAYLNRCTYENDLLVPIIFAFDESLLANRKSTIAPLKFTTSLLKQSLRNKEEYWRTLCFIPDMSAHESKAEQRKQSSQEKNQRLQMLFRAGLQSYLDSEFSINDVEMQLGSVTKFVNLKVPCCLILGDIQGGDKLCGRILSYRTTSSRLCRKCNVPGDKAADMSFNCKRMSMRKIKRLVRRKDEVRLAEYSQHLVEAPWYEIDYGGCIYGIFSAAQPSEWLHAMDNGLIMYCNHILKEVLSVDAQKTLDNIVQRWTDWPRQRLMSSGSEKSMLRLLWKEGVFTMTDVAATYRVGQMLTFVVLSLRKDGNSVLTRALPETHTITAMRKSFQKLLAYREWLHRTSFWQRGDTVAKAKVKTQIAKDLTYVQKHWPRDAGQGWCLPKMHEQLHVPDDIERNGPPATTFTGVTEHHHVSVKRHCERTQKIKYSLDFQTGMRMAESSLINEYHGFLENHLGPSLETTVPVGKNCSIPQSAATGVLSFNNLNGEVESVFKSRSSGFCISGDVIEAICQEYSTAVDTSLWFTSELRNKTDLFRSINNYKSNQNGWHDWVMLRYNKNLNRKYQLESCYAWFGDAESIQKDHDYAPGRIKAIFATSPIKDICEIDDINIVVETCEFLHSKSSQFSTKWKRAFVYETESSGIRRKLQRLEVIPASSIVRHCLMIPEEDNGEFIHEIWNKGLWGKTFVNM